MEDRKVILETKNLEKERHPGPFFNYLKAVGVFLKNHLFIFADRKRAEEFFAAIINFDFKGSIEQAPFESLVPETTNAQAVLEGVGSGYTVTELEARCIALLISTIKPRKIFEFGTNLGSTTLLFALNAPKECRIFTLDLPPENHGDTGYRLERGEESILPRSKVGIRFRNHPLGKRIIQLLADSAKLDESQYEGQFDLIFVDGSHAYEYVKSDTEKALKMLAPGGVILWHDYAALWPGPRAYLDRLNSMLKLYRIQRTSLVIYLNQVKNKPSSEGTPRSRTGLAGIGPVKKKMLKMQLWLSIPRTSGTGGHDAFCINHNPLF